MYTREHTLSRLCHDGEITRSSHVGTLLCIVHCIQIQINFSAKVPSKIAWAEDYYIHDTKCQSEKSPGWFMVALNGRKTLMNIFFSIKTRRVFPLHRLVLSLSVSIDPSLSIYISISLSLSLSARFGSRIVAHWSILSVLLSPQRPSFPFRRLNAFLKWPKKVLEYSVRRSYGPIKIALRERESLFVRRTNQARDRRAATFRRN